MPTPDDTQKTIDYPSALTQVQIMAHGKPHLITIPKNELFRIKEIVTDNEYALPSEVPANRRMTILDVGANVGVFALYAKMAYPNSIIHCFEPAPATVNLLVQNTAPLAGVSIHPFALSNRDYEATLHVNPTNTGENSLVFESEGANETMVTVREANRVLTELELGHIDVLKIDTEGCEVEILNALRERLGTIDYVVVEYQSESDRREIDQLLAGFVLFGSRAEVAGCGVVKYARK